ncbi:NAD(P)H-hydrate dehydratase [Pseudooceanicola sp.]|uniref:NAD(P)H-hydrate dehydratase n=1 Tax=Pseudooceanicola sp. TaxID=1914328 RepID=UPI002624C8D4|nr:NAD(P)H-hydrate dehydratase [Pseudooceanicola sp.]MDF1854763.1 NAD(P)H-hydrate dehydratase [Pseudooceanicola sp.]
MQELLTAAQMRALEQAAIDSGAVSGLELMERAGQGVVAAIFAQWPDLAGVPARAVVLCGPGNNGGDGFVVARLLSGWGWEVAVYLAANPENLPPDARANYQRWCEIGAVQGFPEGGLAPQPGALIVDALFGTGLTRPVAAPLLGALRDNSARVVAVDLPSGLCSDSGKVLGTAAVRADLTVTFDSAKLGHVLGQGPELCGKLVIKDIGLGMRPGAIAPVRPNPPAKLLDQDRLGNLAKPNGHKFAHGHALILSGGAARSGAARLAARGALRIGAGLVTLGVPGSAQMEVAAQITAIMLRRVDDAEALTAVLEDRRITALCLGPGLGIDRAGPLIAAALNAASAPAVVLDADALSAIAQERALFRHLTARCVLTPHAGEFARLFPDIAARLTQVPDSGPAFSKVDATRAAAARAGCVVLFKGADTVIAAPDGRCAVNSAAYARAVPWLATAGAGDVLAGFVAGLLARGWDPFRAACDAAWLHVGCAKAFGPGLIAEDLPEVLPQVLREVIG